VTIYLVTKWQEGIIEEIEGCNLNQSDPYIAELKRAGEITQYFGQGDWFEKRSEAIREAKRLRRSCVNQMRSDIKRLNQLTFS
jgi:hypothetical protein